ncbi:MAG: ATP/GTP-binding protein [Brevinemataceae bacterium]
MKISFTGTHGIGKTTLAVWLSEILNISYIPEFAREFLENGFQINTPLSFIEFECKILEKKLEYERNVFAESDSVISDRSYLDYAVYLKNGLSRFPYDDIKDLEVDGQKITHFFNKYESLCREHNKIYDLIFFVTPFTEFISPEFDYREKNPFATNIIQDLLFNEYRNEINKDRVVVVKEKELGDRKRMIIQTLKERSLLAWDINYLDEEI